MLKMKCLQTILLFLVGVDAAFYFGTLLTGCGNDGKCIPNGYCEEQLLDGSGSGMASTLYARSNCHPKLECCETFNPDGIGSECTANLDGQTKNGVCILKEDCEPSSRLSLKDIGAGSCTPSSDFVCCFLDNP